MKTQNEYTGAKILVVEDSRTQAEYLRHILENVGYHVVLATNGNDALEQIRCDRPTIVLTDILMPEMDGYSLCRAIKRDPSTADIPVILVTQLFDPADLLKGLEAGANNIIIKPFEPEHVTSRITGTLRSLSHPCADEPDATLEMSFDGQTHQIPASQLRSPTILISTYDLAIKKNAELQGSLERLSADNEDLKRIVGELQRANENLLLENNERKRMEEILAKENKKLQIMAGLTRDHLLTQLNAMHECLEMANNIREEEPTLAWEKIIKAEMVVNQTIKTLK
jgi:two-component system, sensor histidine kinase and response regulator